MQADILEQLAANYLEAQGYVTISNVKFRPATSRGRLATPGSDSVHSDIDVLGFNPRLSPPKRVVAVTLQVASGRLLP